MKQLIIALGISASALTMQSTLADEANEGAFFGQKAPGKWIVGLKAADVENDFDDALINGNSQDLGEASGIGIVLGYEFARPVGANGSATVEFEYIKSNDGNVGVGNLGTWDADVYSLFFGYRSAGTLYFKAKAGVQHNSIDFESPLVLGEFNDTSLAFGIGLGLRIKDYGVIELEYSKDTGDNDIGILGLNALLEF